MADNVRIKVDIQAGIVELDAPLAAVDDLLARIEAFVPVLRENQPSTVPPEKPAGKKPKQKQADVDPEPATGASDVGAKPAAKRAASRGKQRGEVALRVLPDLNLRPDGKQSLRDFIEAKQPGSNERAFPVIVYYLKKELEIEHVTLNHMYTAFKDLNRKVPTRLGTVMSNSTKRHGWLDTSSTDDIGITIHGENFVEHDLPPKKTKKGKS